IFGLFTAALAPGNGTMMNNASSQSDLVFIGISSGICALSSPGFHVFAAKHGPGRPLNATHPLPTGLYIRWLALASFPSELRQNEVVIGCSLND
ncbi:MAG TPA: hypothetical protein VFL79_21225, partial [Terriglobia bacterium]|nr:hypothetical protein [Terriglobia bacterium]